MRTAPTANGRRASNDSDLCSVSEGPQSTRDAYTSHPTEGRALCYHKSYECLGNMSIPQLDWRCHHEWQ